MNQKSEYLIQVLEKIGAPLMSSIIEVSTEVDDGDTAADILAAQSAKKMAELLGKSVQIGIDLGKNMDLASSDDQGESLRISLTALAGQLVAEQYRQAKSIPDDNAIAKTVASLQAVMTFSENFVPSPEAVQRIKSIEAQGAIVDERQTTVQLIHVFLPIILAVSNFSFGMNEHKLIQDISKRLIEKASALRADVFGGTLSVDEEKSVDLAFLRSLTQIYAACHAMEMNKLVANDMEEPRDNEELLKVLWEDFEMRASMVSTLAIEFAPGSTTSRTGQVPEQQTAAPIADQPVVIEPPQEPVVPIENSSTEPEKPPKTDEAEPVKTTGGSPMSFFKQSDDNKDNEE